MGTNLVVIDWHGDNAVGDRTPVSGGDLPQVVKDHSHELDRTEQARLAEVLHLHQAPPIWRLHHLEREARDVPLHRRALEPLPNEPLDLADRVLGVDGERADSISAKLPVFRSERYQCGRLPIAFFVQQHIDAAFPSHGNGAGLVANIYSADTA